ncbi:MAG TPA: PDZ domain-containing protein [Gemmataceae bacterium]|nr:PDZ domain-containing protein [Gemmataceae bacterium]
MSAVSTCVIGWALLSPTAAPVPADPPPDPLARGYLGASFGRSPQDNPLAVIEVTPGTPAAKAGLQKGDEIVRVGTFEPHTFDELVTHICSYRPGAVVEVEVRRDGERKVFQVTLTVRPPQLDPVPIPIPTEPFDGDK